MLSMKKFSIPDHWIHYPCIIIAALMILFPLTGKVLSLFTGRPIYDLLPETKVIWSLLLIPVTFSLYNGLKFFETTNW